MLLAQWFDGGVQPWLFLSQHPDAISVGFIVFGVLCLAVAALILKCL